MSLTPKELIQNYDADVARWLSKIHANHEVCHTLLNLDQDLARRIYIGCRSKPEDLEYYIQNEKPLSRLLPAVLGAFSAKCALCTCDANRRSEIRKAFKADEGTMFPMPELEGWFKTIEDNVRSCPTRHSRFEIWPLLRMLRVKVEEPKVAKIETQYYD